MNLLKLIKFDLIYFFILSFIGCNVVGQDAVSKVYFHVNDYGVVNDSTVLQTEKINDLIHQVNEKGGGTIYFPAGTYLTGPITLLSNITLFLDAGSKIKFSDNFDDYLPMVQSRFEGVDIKSFHPLIYAYGAKNIAIIGRGVLEGQGRKWWLKHFELEKKYPEYTSKYQEIFRKENEGMVMPDNPFMFEYGFCRPPFFQPMYCDNIRLEGITIQNSPFWTVNPEFCNNVTINGIKVVNPDGPNTDGINPESCSNVHISDCHISVGDDCITIKSGKDLPGRQKGVPCENITITNCTMLTGHGGVVIGSEMSGGVRNVVISNCIFDGTDRGIRIKSTRGRGGVVEDIRVSNIVMRNIKREAIMLNLFYSKAPIEPVSERTPQFKNIHVSHITGDAEQAVAIIGLPEMPVENISFTDILLETKSGIQISNAKDVRLHMVRINNTEGSSFDIKQSANILLNNCTREKPDNGFPVITFDNVQFSAVTGAFQQTDVKTYLKISGNNSKSVIFKNNIMLNAINETEISEEVDQSTIIKE